MQTTILRAMLNKSPRGRAPRFGMGCKAQTAAIAPAMARPSPDTRSPCGLRVLGEGQGHWPCAACKACNAADRPKRGCRGRTQSATTSSWPGSVKSMRTPKGRPWWRCFCGESTTTRHDVMSELKRSRYCAFSRTAASTASERSMPWNVIWRGERIDVLRSSARRSPRVHASSFAPRSPR